MGPTVARPTRRTLEGPPDLSGLAPVWRDLPTRRDRVHFTYAYDGAGNRVSRSNELHSAFSEQYAYDDLNRLTGTDRGGSDYQDWTLDQQGNWTEFDDGTTQTRGFNEANEITSISGQDDPEYDAAGNMIFDGTQHYRYDAWNRLVEAWTDDNGDPDDLIARYSYDGRGYRIAKAVALYEGDPGVITGYDRTDFYYNDSWQVLEERFEADAETATAAAETPHVQYLWDIRYVDAPVFRWRDKDLDMGDPEPDGLEETLYYANDANMNVTALVATDGAVVERYLYDPYGKPAVLHGVRDAEGNNTSPNEWEERGEQYAFASEVLYAGYRLDLETELYHVRNRSYDSALGRWISRDTLGYVDGANLYAYCQGNPPATLDPLGNRIFIIKTLAPKADDGEESKTGMMTLCLLMRYEAHQDSPELRDKLPEIAKAHRDLLETKFNAMNLSFQHDNITWRIRLQVIIKTDGVYRSERPVIPARPAVDAPRPADFNSTAEWLDAMGKWQEVQLSYQKALNEYEAKKTEHDFQMALNGEVSFSAFTRVQVTMNEHTTEIAGKQYLYWIPYLVPATADVLKTWQIPFETILLHELVGHSLNNADETLSGGEAIQERYGRENFQSSIMSYETGGNEPKVFQSRHLAAGILDQQNVPGDPGKIIDDKTSLLDASDPWFRSRGALGTRLLDSIKKEIDDDTRRRARALDPAR